MTINEQILFDIRLDNIILRDNLIEASATAAAAGGPGSRRGGGHNSSRLHLERTCRANTCGIICKRNHLVTFSDSGVGYRPHIVIVRSINCDIEKQPETIKLHSLRRRITHSQGR